MERKFSYRDIVRLTFAGTYTQREIALAAGCSIGSVANVQTRIRASGIDKESALKLSEDELRGLFNKNRGPKPSDKYVQPDFAMIQRQLEQYKGLTLMIL